MIRRFRLAVLFVCAAMFVAAPAGADDKLKVVASISIIGDLVKSVGGDRVDVTMLVGPNSDAHVFSPTPSDAKTLGAAKAVFINGMGLEGWITRLIAAAGTKSKPVVVSAGITPRQAEEGGHHTVDPHAWQSVANVKIYVTNIRNGLKKADPAGGAAYDANAKAYLGKLDELEREVRETIGKIPADRRKIITTHDAFGYFKDAYGVEFIAPQGVSTESEASARDVARIIQQIRKQKIPAVFLENISDPRLLKRIADETGAKMGGTLYSDALTDEKGDAPTYIDLIRHNIRTLGAALMT